MKKIFRYDERESDCFKRNDEATALSYETKISNKDEERTVENERNF